jgi:hypothetical protein
MNSKLSKVLVILGFIFIAFSIANYIVKYSGIVIIAIFTIIGMALVAVGLFTVKKDMKKSKNEKMGTVTKFLLTFLSIKLFILTIITIVLFLEGDVYLIFFSIAVLYFFITFSIYKKYKFGSIIAILPLSVEIVFYIIGAINFSRDLKYEISSYIIISLVYFVGSIFWNLIIIYLAYRNYKKLKK